MKPKSPRYFVRNDSGSWQIVDREIGDFDDLQIIAILQSEACARSACESLNRGLCQTIAPDGRWTS